MKSTRLSFDAERAARWAVAERCRAAFVAAARIVAETGGELLAMKGVHLAYLDGADPWFRPFTDADGIVVGVPLRRVSAEFAVRDGWRVWPGNTWGAVTVHRGDGTAVDLHRAPLPPGFGRLDVAVLRRRTSPVANLGSSRAPDALDAAVISLAHFVKDGLSPFTPVDSDLSLLESLFAIDPPSLAERLSEHGLRRVGLVALIALARRSVQHSARWEPWASACSTGKLEWHWAQTVATLAWRAAGWPYVRGTILRAVADDAPASARGLACWFAHNVRDWGHARWIDSR